MSTRQDAVDRYEADVHAAGFGSVWAHLLEQDDTATARMLLGIVGALAIYLRETGFKSPA